MPEHVNVEVNTLGLTEASIEIERIARERIAPAANLIEEAFSTAANSIQSNLARAAERGELSLKKLTNALLRDLRRFAIDSLVRQPVQNFLTNALTGAFGGARANGGVVAPGQSFLVGERGPELFTPAGAGNIRPLNAAYGAGGMTVNINLPGVTDTQSFKRSETQIAAALARAVGRGQRNL
ncbi:phage tail tape measure C-terminal domain-containing protein [Hyphococcus flavus]|uniref:Phage tail tape measure C-terminal domain-containing protein n=1 Tax=Hyphococcus flavus TaxID=1866326 RepID=A0AAE9ZEA8_9PROT|nr:phage tail tape measure C-terminal domain-containing protein [Hyphococcus flavus]WDI32150.1 phage tail tape measure C-terminal domain-containing protein [Hyphococcus flavus]